MGGATPQERIGLDDSEAGTHAEILASRGLNCFRFQGRVNDRPVEILHHAPDFAQGSAAPSGSGIPILFPFPNRIRSGRFEFAGKRYALPVGDPFGNAIHGLVLDRPWRITGQGEAAEGGQWVEGCFRARRDAPRLSEQWPADFQITMRYALRGNALAATVRVDNPDDKPLPFGFGIHPYFRLPLETGGDASRCTVQVPAEARWVLDRCLPTGEVVPVEGSYDLRNGLGLASLDLDDVLTHLAFEGDVATCRLVDRACDLEVTLQFDRFFREVVAYTPPDKPAVCLEPYTCATDAINLHERGVDAGLRILEPGAQAGGRFVIRVRSLG